MFFSKRAFSASSNDLRFSAGKLFLLLFVFRAAVTFIRSPHALRKYLTAQIH